MKFSTPFASFGQGAVLRSPRSATAELRPHLPRCSVNSRVRRDTGD
jgi:hypothetical protein